MRTTCVTILSILCFQSFSQLEEVDWISPKPHGHQFQHIAKGFSSNYFAVARGGYFFELDANLNVINRSEIGNAVEYFFKAKSKVIHVISLDVVYLTFKEGTNISDPVRYLVSTDGGKTWGPSPLEFRHLKTLGDTAYGITNTGHFSSFDGGQNWNLNWSGDSLNVFDMVGDTVVYVRAQKELRMRYGNTDSLLLDFMAPFSAPPPSYSLTDVAGLDYLSTDFGILRLVNAGLVRIDHRKNEIDTVYYERGARLHHMGNYNYYTLENDEITIYTDTLKTVTHHTTAVNLNHRMVVPSDSGALVRYAHEHNGSFMYRYGFIDFADWSITDKLNYRFPGRIGSIYQKKNGDILTFTDDHIHLWENATDQISHFKSSTEAVKIGRNVDSEFGVLLTSGKGAAAFSTDEGETWQDIRANRSPPGIIRIQSATEFVSIWDNPDWYANAAPHNIQFIYSLDQGKTWDRSSEMPSGYGISDAWVFGTDSVLAITASWNAPTMYTLPDLPFNQESRNPPNSVVHDMKFLSDGNLLAVTENGFYISTDNARSWAPRASMPTSIDAGFDDLQFSANGMLYLWNRDSSELIFTQDTGTTLSRIQFFPHGLMPRAGQKGDLFFVFDNRLAIYKVPNDIAVDDWFKPETNFVIYPNPANSAVRFELPESFEDSRMEIYNLEGHLQLSEVTTSINPEVDVSELAAGIYVVKITNGSKSISKKLLVLR